MDKALSVRKQAVISFTAVVLEFQDSKYEKIHRYSQKWNCQDEILS